MKTTKDTNPNAENTSPHHDCVQETRICLIEKDVTNLHDSDTENKGLLKELNKTMTDTKLVIQSLQDYIANKEKEQTNWKNNLSNGIIVGVVVGVTVYIVNGLIHIL